MKILLLEDDETLGETLRHFLRKAGYDVDTVSTVEEAETRTFEGCYDLYLLDINLPDGSGIDLLSSLRFAEDETPTIFITALTDMNAMEEGFKLGAIDYIKKPFDPTELLIRIKAKFDNGIVRYGEISYDTHSHLCRKNGEIVDLANVQSKIFEKLLTHCGEVVTKQTLYECLEHPSDTALRVALTKIKQKLGIEIKNIRGRGYLLEKL